MSSANKPPFRIPTMPEICAVPPNGLRAVSTFSGCGGACLGLRWAGFQIVWASEFIEAARDTYRANFPETPLDARDIREVRPEEILEMAGLRAGELDLFEGSPPCASFSTAGKREKHWGQAKKYSDTIQRTDDLFEEYVRLVRGLRPRAFVAENVSGLVKGSAKGYFKAIFRQLEALGYRVEARLLDASWLGVPQRRQRIIFVGLRDGDPGLVFPRPLPYRYTVRDALPWISETIRAAGGGAQTAFEAEAEAGSGALITKRGIRSLDEPAPTILQHGRPGTQSEISIARYAIGAEWDRLRPGETSERYFNLIRADADAPCPTVTQTGGNVGAAAVTHPTEKRKFTIAELRRLCGFPDDFELTGTYTQQWERLGRAVPPPMYYHVGLGLARALAGGECDGEGNGSGQARRKPRRDRKARQ